MFKMGCSMARKILGPTGSTAASNGDNASAEQQAACFSLGGGGGGGNGGGASSKSGKSTSGGGGGGNGKSGENSNNINAASSPSPPQKQKTTNSSELNDFSKLEEDPRIPLNVRQIFKITKSWKAIARTMSKTGTAMFLNLFEQNADLFYLFDRFQHLKGKDLHESMELREHAATVMSTLDTSINSLGDYDNFVTYLRSIGEMHRKVPGFKREYFWKIEQPFMKAVKQTLDERCNETIEEIYKIAIKLIIETIADGYGQDASTGDGAHVNMTSDGDDGGGGTRYGGSGSGSGSGGGGGNPGHDKSVGSSGGGGNGNGGGGGGGNRTAGARERTSAAGNQCALSDGGSSSSGCVRQNGKIKQIKLTTTTRAKATTTTTTTTTTRASDLPTKGNNNILKEKRKLQEVSCPEPRGEGSHNNCNDCKAAHPQATETHVSAAVINNSETTTTAAAAEAERIKNKRFSCRFSSKRKAPFLDALKSTRNLRRQIKSTSVTLARLAKRLPGARWCWRWRTTKKSHCIANAELNESYPRARSKEEEIAIAKAEEPLADLVLVTCELLRTTSDLIGQQQKRPNSRGQCDTREDDVRSTAAAAAAAAAATYSQEEDQAQDEDFAKLTKWRNLISNLTDQAPPPPPPSSEITVSANLIAAAGITSDAAAATRRSSMDERRRSNQTTSASSDIPNERETGSLTGTPPLSGTSDQPLGDQPTNCPAIHHSCCRYSSAASTTKAQTQTQTQTTLASQAQSIPERPCGANLANDGPSAVKSAVQQQQQRTSEAVSSSGASDLVDFIKLLLLINKLILASASLKAAETTATTTRKQPHEAPICPRSQPTRCNYNICPQVTSV